MTELNKKAAGGLSFFCIALAAILFLSAWTFNYWQAWVFLAVFSLSTILITVYLARNDPALLERRIHAGPGAEKDKRQKLIQAFATVAFNAVFIVPGLDRRFEWSRVPPFVSIAGDALVALGLFIVFLVFKENTFTAGTIQVAERQRVVATGPYGWVRHPMYSGAMVMLIGVPIALGSWWGILTFIPISSVIVWRLVEEEKFLVQNLPGYSDYQHNVRYRLLPLVW